MNLREQFEALIAADMTIGVMLIKLALTLVMTQLVAWHYIYFARVLSNRSRFSRVLVFMGVTTMLVILVVKSSLALSLGLVGALSVIRFRTPVKEAEDLAYLFLCIAAGIGIGANQEVLTVIAIVVILAYMSLSARVPFAPSVKKALLQVSTPLSSDDGKSDSEVFETLVTALHKVTSDVSLTRMDRHEGVLNASWTLDLVDEKSIAQLLSSINDTLPDASVTVIDKDNLG